ncbi:hypothetical protein ACIRD8_36815 [Streptomyces sp. NPDC102451]|uniref:thiolase family protein n=1 Tax=Streptomyces sp. NPDC102451 TaxID=3366177 RepID=UPI00380EFA9A
MASGLNSCAGGDVIRGCVSQASEQTADIARTAVLTAGGPDTATGVTIDRQCGSSQQAIAFAAVGLIAGQYDVVVAGAWSRCRECPWAPRGAKATRFRSGMQPSTGVPTRASARR